jgi:HAD superfamily hydrolase (TIGR01549 family)
MVIRAVLFDLFGTLVHFSVRVPVIRVAGMQRHTTMPWLEEAFERELPGVDFDRFLEAIAAVTAEIVRARPPEQLEVPSPVRFERALTRLGLAPEVVRTAAPRLSLAHMSHLASSVELPEGHVDVLAALAPRFHIALVSNFDHAATARALLDRFGLTPFLQRIVISEDFGRRKPHPAIFREALDQLGVGAHEAVFVGDSPIDDVVGGKNAGMRVVWINADDHPLPDGTPAPDAIVASLRQLPGVLASGL